MLLRIPSGIDERRIEHPSRGVEAAGTFEDEGSAVGRLYRRHRFQRRVKDPTSTG